MNTEFIQTQKPFITFGADGERRTFDSEASAVNEYGRLLASGYNVRLTNGRGYYRLVEEEANVTAAVSI